MNNSGYLHTVYAQSLNQVGEPLRLPASKGWILKRPIPGTGQFDGMGCYPIFVCHDWSALGTDLEELENQLICISLVTDPFGRYNQQDLLNTFIDIARPYKQHFVIDLQQRPDEFVAAHHQRNAQKAMKIASVEVCSDPIKHLDEWVDLYSNLIERHNITGIAKFSVDSFTKQLSTPGIVAFRAIVDKKTVGMLLWYVQDKIGYYHLGAYSPDGYKVNASFALFWTAINYFASIGSQWLSLGAGAGIQGDAKDGLTRFKRGWSTGTRTAYFCGRIFNPQKYQELVKSKKTPPTEFFPAYRLGEF